MTIQAIRSEIASVAIELHADSLIADTLNCLPPQDLVVHRLQSRIPITPDAENGIGIHLRITSADGEVWSYEQHYSTTDSESPQIHLFNSQACVVPGDSLHFRVTGRDNASIQRVVVTTSGAMAATDSLVFSQPYPRYIDARIAMLVPASTVFGQRIAADATVFDAAGNRAEATLDPLVLVQDIRPPTVELLGPLRTIVRGESLAVIVRATDNYRVAKVSCEFGISPAEFIRSEQTVASQDTTVVFSYWIPQQSDGFNLVHGEIVASATDAFGHTARTETVRIPMEGRIAVSEAVISELRSADARQLLVDLVHQRAYVPSPSRREIEVYDLSARSMLSALTLPYDLGTVALTPDGMSLVMSEARGGLLHVYDVAGSTIEERFRLDIAPTGRDYGVGDIVATSDTSAVIVVKNQNRNRSHLMLVSLLAPRARALSEPDEDYFQWISLFGMAGSPSLVLAGYRGSGPMHYWTMADQGRLVIATRDDLGAAYVSGVSVNGASVIRSGDGWCLYNEHLESQACNSNASGWLSPDLAALAEGSDPVLLGLRSTAAGGVALGFWSPVESGVTELGLLPFRINAAIRALWLDPSEQRCLVLYGDGLGTSPCTLVDVPIRQ